MDERVIRADGYKYLSGWYLDRNFTESCAAMISGCHGRDVSCHDRHALQRLIRCECEEVGVVVLLVSW